MHYLLMRASLICFSTNTISMLFVSTNTISKLFVSTNTISFTRLYGIAFQQSFFLQWPHLSCVWKWEWKKLSEKWKLWTIFLLILWIDQMIESESEKSEIFPCMVWKWKWKKKHLWKWKLWTFPCKRLTKQLVEVVNWLEKSEAYLLYPETDSDALQTTYQVVLNWNF